MGEFSKAYKINAFTKNTTLTQIGLYFMKKEVVQSSTLYFQIFHVTLVTKHNVSEVPMPFIYKNNKKKSLCFKIFRIFLQKVVQIEGKCNLRNSHLIASEICDFGDLLKKSTPVA